MSQCPTESSFSTGKTHCMRLQFLDRLGGICQSQQMLSIFCVLSRGNETVVCDPKCWHFFIRKNSKLALPKYSPELIFLSWRKTATQRLEIHKFSVPFTDAAYSCSCCPALIFQACSCLFLRVKNDRFSVAGNYTSTCETRQGREFIT